MKRMHIHVTVPNLEESVLFYNSLFGEEPSKLKSDYAKWSLEEPQVNFAISTRSSKPGLDHLGIQVDQASELEEINTRMTESAQQIGEISEGICCYAESTKAWTMDKAGIPWETFTTMKDVEVYGMDIEKNDSAYCVPDQPSKSSCC